MKNRVLMVLVFAVALLSLAVGCGKKEENNNSGSNNNNNQQPAVEEKKLECSSSEKDSKTTEEFKYTYNYKGDNFDKVTVQSTTKFTSGKYDEKVYKEYGDECKEVLEKTKKAGLTCNVQASGSSIWVTYQFTIADLNKESKEYASKLDIDKYEGKKIDEVKSSLETNGFTCTIK